MVNTRRKLSPFSPPACFCSKSPTQGGIGRGFSAGVVVLEDRRVTYPLLQPPPHLAQTAGINLDLSGDRGFAHSPLEQRGFELQVPPKRRGYGRAPALAREP